MPLSSNLETCLLNNPTCRTNLQHSALFSSSDRSKKCITGLFTPVRVGTQHVAISHSSSGSRTQHPSVGFHPLWTLQCYIFSTSLRTIAFLAYCTMIIFQFPYLKAFHSMSISGIKHCSKLSTKDGTFSEDPRKSPGRFCLITSRENKMC